LNNNHDDVGAELFRSKWQKHQCCSFFEDDMGPFKIKLLKGKAVEFDVYAKAALREMKAAEATSQGAGGAEQESFATPCKEKRAAATKRARDALKKSHEDSASKRVVILS
jgi:hypothetical protein